MSEEGLDPATAAVLAHGLLNSLSAVQVVVDLLLRTHDDVELSARLAEVVKPQLALMDDSLRILISGLPDDVLAQLVAPR